MPDEFDGGGPAAKPTGPPDEPTGPPSQPPGTADQLAQPPTGDPYGAAGPTGELDRPPTGDPYGAPGDRYGAAGPTGELDQPPTSNQYWAIGATNPAASATPAGRIGGAELAGEPSSMVPAGPRRRRFWPRRWWTRAIVVLLALALVSGGVVLLQDRVGKDAADATRSPSANAEPGPTHPNLLASNRDAFNALLGRRAEAVADGDLQAFLADLDPGKTKLLRRQRLLFRNLGLLPVKSLEYLAESYLPPVPTQADNPDGAFNPGSGIIQARLQLVDADPRPTLARYAVKVALRAGKLVITDISSDGMARPYSPTPWDSSTLTVVRTTHMVIGVTPDEKERAQEVADAAERAYQTSLGLWPRRARKEFVIFAAGKRSTFESWYGFGDDTPDSSIGRALTIPTCCLTKNKKLGDSTSTHIILDLSELSDPIDLEWTLAHELTHAVSQPREAADNDAPKWATEGYAEYVGIRLLAKRGYYALWARDVREYVAAGKFRDRLPVDENFYGRNSDINYALSVRFFEYLVGEYGESTVKNFFFYLNSMDPLDTNAAMRKYFHASQKKVVANWAAWVRSS